MDNRLDVVDAERLTDWFCVVKRSVNVNIVCREDVNTEAGGVVIIYVATPAIDLLHDSPRKTSCPAG